MRTLAAPVELTEEVKRSRFLALAARADQPERALAFLEARRDPGASHNCWAYRIGQDCRFADDGEPGGTAGRPILSAIDGQGLDHVVVLVIRWFGGIKLGAGGLVRAYGGAAGRCLAAGRVREVEARRMLDIEAPFDELGKVHALFARFHAEALQESFHAGGVRWSLKLRDSTFEPFRSELQALTRGRARVTIHRSKTGE